MLSHTHMHTAKKTKTPHTYKSPVCSQKRDLVRLMLWKKEDIMPQHNWTFPNLGLTIFKPQWFKKYLWEDLPI